MTAVQTQKAVNEQIQVAEDGIEVREQEEIAHNAEDLGNILVTKSMKTCLIFYSMKTRNYIRRRF